MTAFANLCFSLAVAVEAEDMGWYEKSSELLNAAASIAGKYGCKKFFSLYEAVMTEIAWRKNKRSSEAAVVGLFLKNIHKIIAGAKIAPYRTSKSNRPDAWVDIDGEVIPVEVKKGAFNLSAFAQLSRYLDYFDCERGIAVGSEDAVGLPPNIIFISIADIMAAEER